MPKPQYGSEHQKARAIALTMLAHGTPCRYCGRPMYRWQALDLDHIVPVAIGHGRGPTTLVHAHCNRSHGASMGNRMRKGRRIRRRRSLPSWL
jgi:hypothetical protein